MVETIGDRGAINRRKLFEVLRSRVHHVVEHGAERATGVSNRHENDRADDRDANGAADRAAQRHRSDCSAERFAAGGMLNGNLHRGHHHPQSNTGERRENENNGGGRNVDRCTQHDERDGCERKPDDRKQLDFTGERYEPSRDRRAGDHRERDG